MKSERRHELQQNALATALASSPSYLQRYGGRIVLGLVIVLLVIFVIRMRITSSRESHRAAVENLAGARSLIEELRYVDLAFKPTEAIAVDRRNHIDNATQAIANVRDLTEDPDLIAQALLARGDLNWLVANLGELPGAATQPALQVEGSAEERLSVAEAAYQEILRSHANHTYSVAGAHLGLAAIAENRGKWDEAKQHYEAVVNHADIIQPFKTQAEIRLEQLKQLQQPAYIVSSTAPAATTQPATTQETDAAIESQALEAPAATQPADAPTTAPAQ